MSAKRWTIELCTCPSESRPIKWSVPPVAATCASACRNVGFLANSPEAISASINVTPCGTDASAAKVHMADFAVAHHARWETNSLA